MLVAPETTKFQYTDGVSDLSRIAPTIGFRTRCCWIGRATPKSRWISSTTIAPTCRSTRQVQAYFRKHRPPTLIVWGKNDKIFPADGAYPYKRDLPEVEFHLIDTGHFALEDKGGRDGAADPRLPRSKCEIRLAKSGTSSTDGSRPAAGTPGNELTEVVTRERSRSIGARSLRRCMKVCGACTCSPSWTRKRCRSSTRAVLQRSKIYPTGPHSFGEPRRGAKRSVPTLLAAPLYRVGTARRCAFAPY